jgi:molybdopterin/thiamine biosynthesis adenylyltransferase
MSEVSPLLAAPISASPLATLGGRGVLVVGAGGLGSPVLSVLAKSGVGRFTLLDDDVVEASNLQRQTLYAESDVGARKVDVAARKIRELSPLASVHVECVADRLAPDNALELVRDHVLIVEGADNFATKFLAADAAKLGGVPIVQAGAVRFSGWALAWVPEQGACMRCVFEDIPRGQPETCAVAGVLGPVVGVLGALEAALAIEVLLGRVRAASVLWSYDALAGKLRKRRVARRQGCPLCEGRIRDLALERYVNDCAA